MEKNLFKSNVVIFDNKRRGDKMTGVVQQKAELPDNQQERLCFASWIVGFVDGEGCFTVSFIRNKTNKLGSQVFVEFVVTQGEKSRKSLELMKSFFGCGKIYVNRRYDNHKENIYRYCVRSIKDLKEKIIPFFEIYPLQTEKKKEFEKFKTIVEMMINGEHLDPVGREKIMEIASSMNRKKKRGKESSEAIRRSR
jgi:hypothetical protein